MFTHKTSFLWSQVQQKNNYVLSSTVQLGITLENEKKASVKVTVSRIMFKRKLEWQRGLISYKVSKTSTSLLTLLISKYNIFISREMPG